MSTDLYGIRVLDVVPGESRARFRVFVVYYDTEDRSHAPLPDDPSFFFRALWEAAQDRPATSSPSMRAIDLDEAGDPWWIAANSHRYVRRTTRIAARNHPVADDGWARLHDFYYERDGRWRDEDLLVQADYDVEVTDPRWLEPLSPGYSWATASYAVESDQVLADDAPTVLDLREPAVTLRPFPDEETDEGTPSDVAFSDDGAFLAVTSQACELVVFRTGDWGEHTRVAWSSLWGQDIRWVPGTHQVTGRGDGATRAYDVDSDTEVDVRGRLPEAPDRTDTISRPDGNHVVAGEQGRLDLVRVSDNALLMRGRTGGRYLGGLSWSPDGDLFAASVITGYDGYGGYVRIYRAAPPVAEPSKTTTAHQPAPSRTGTRP